MARLKRRFAGLGRVAIPGAYILADVATEDMLPDTGAHRFRYRSAQLNREIRNAATGIDLVSSPGDRLSRTSIHAARAGPAAIGRRGIGFDLERCDHLAQKKPRPDLLIDQASVFADPAEPGFAGIGSLQQRRRVDADLVVLTGRQLPNHPLQALTHHVMIIVAPGVTGDPARFGIIQLGGTGLGTVLKFTNSVDRAGGSEQKLRIGSDGRAPVGQIAHRAGHSALYPVQVAPVVLGKRLGARDAG